jgi:Zn-dependent protease with chaperone function
MDVPDPSSADIRPNSSAANPHNSDSSTPSTLPDTAHAQARLTEIKGRYKLICGAMVSVWCTFFVGAAFSPVLLLSASPWFSFCVLLISLSFSMGLWQTCTDNEEAQQEKWRQERNAVVADAASSPFLKELPAMAQIIGIAKPGLLIVPNHHPLLQIFSPVSWGVTTRIMLSTGFHRISLNARERRAAIAHELGHIYLRAGLWDALADCAGFTAYGGTFCLAVALTMYWQWHWLAGLLLVVLLTTASHFLGLAFTAFMSRIHEHGADEVADLMAGPGAIADCLVRADLWHLAHGYKLKRVYPQRWRDWPRYLYLAAMSDHPHDLARIKHSRKNAKRAA